MKVSDLREKTIQELHDREHELAEQLFALRLQKVSGRLEKPSTVRATRRELARTLTVLGEKRKQG